MKLKPLGKRAHNIMFHTHTVAGIVISFALFIMFYAGAIALFKDEIYKWENPNARFEAPAWVDYIKVHEAIGNAYPNFKEEGQLTYVFPESNIPFVQVYGDLKETDSTTSRFQALVNPENLRVVKSEEPLTTVGDTLYHLHFFDQIPGLGIWLSGLVSLFFLFAIVTGVLIHWKNMVNKFYAFTTKGKWKQIWTNAHTVLGVIGLPFQVIYAVTGALFGLLTLLLAPSAVVLFDGDSAPIFESIRPERAITMNPEAPLSENKSVNELLSDVEAKYSDFEVKNVVMQNFGREDATATFYVDDGEGIVGDGLFVYRMKTGKIEAQIAPNKKTYSQTVYNLLIKLHYATFGGILMKIVYFILAMITCFIIVSGILIWQKARDNSKYTEKQKRFHHRTTKAYLAICLSLFPATALIFLANKLVPMETAERAFQVNSIFFLGWLVLIVVGLFWNDLRKLNRNYLAVGGLLSLFIPIMNGMVTGDWVWVALTQGQWQVASIDIVWFFTGITAVIMVPILSKERKRKNIEVPAISS
ncbi:PepSY-associated TM helix domain-containing protein [Maribacter sp. 2307UL18-2]|uniref:PepSY-associated TM helix domain-containing protein n=1 Tax=Maribacter sp. 2307UL18-2 TaxID=3386274 RepID=UPI0039BD60C6